MAEIPGISKATLGLSLVVLGIITAVGALILRGMAQSDHDYDQQVNQLAGAFGGRRVDTQPFDNTPYLIVGGLAALLVLCGVILYASGGSSDQTQHQPTGQGQGTDT